MLGVLTVQKSPELFHGYIGIGQVVCQSKSECLAYSFMVNEFTAAGDREDAAQIRSSQSTEEAR